MSGCPGRRHALISLEESGLETEKKTAPKNSFPERLEQLLFPGYNPGMIVILKNEIEPREKENLRNYLEEKGLSVKEIRGQKETVWGVVGPLQLDIRDVKVLPGVDDVLRISRPFKQASREFKKEDTVFSVGPLRLGGDRIAVIAGPCAVESQEQILESALRIREAGGVMLRGGAFKPRTSPYSFQGLGEKGLAYLKEAGERSGLPVVSEIVATEDADMMKDYVDMLQIGARNMQNFVLLKRVGALGLPVILKRGLSATIEEWLMAAEYLLNAGTDRILLCERGIRTFEPYTRNTLDLAAVPLVRELSHLPVIVDPSHGTGLRDKVIPMALAAVAAGAQGILVEMHPRPDSALSDGAQSLYPEQFQTLIEDLETLSETVHKEMLRLPDSPSLSVSASAANDDEASSPDTENTPEGVKPCRVLFQGMHGAYSEKALREYFREKEHLVVSPRHRFKDIFEGLLKGEGDAGIIPLENSLSGSIMENYDWLAHYPDVRITGMIRLKISHRLIGRPESRIEDIREVFSHPEGLKQCSDFIEKHGYQARPFYDTAGAVLHVKEAGLKTQAAIAGMPAAERYGMKVLKENVESNPHNYTRFAIIRKMKEADDPKTATQGESFASGKNMASVLFTLPNEPGALARHLAVFDREQINMTRIESRPIPGSPWIYRFYVDFRFQDPKHPEMILRFLERKSKGFRLLGVYAAPS